MEITVTVPDQYLVDYEPGEFAKRIKLYAAMFMFQFGELSAGAAVDLADVDRFTFSAECQKRGIPTVDYPADDLRVELATWRTGD